VYSLAGNYGFIELRQLYFVYSLAGNYGFIEWL